MTKIRPDQIQNPADATKFLNGAGAFTVPGAGSGAVGRTFVTRRANAGGTNDYTVSGTTFADIDATNLILTIAAATGDVLMVNVAGGWVSNAQYGALDAGTYVSGSLVNRISGSANTGDGVLPWSAQPSAVANINGAFFYTVQSGDVSAGNVTLRLMALTYSASSKVLIARPDDPFQFAVINLG